MLNLDKLDDKQREAVRTTEGYVADIAGAGSGKTTALTYRYAYLVKEVGIAPSAILCVTFTNKAAKEMKERITKLIDDKCDTTFICTLHSFCVKVLHRDIECLSFSPRFTIMDATDQKSLLREVYAELDLKPSELPFKEVVSFIEKQKTSAVWENWVKVIIGQTNPGVPAEKEPEETEEDFLKRRIFIQYLRFQKKNFVLDFTDLITFTLYLFRHYKTQLEYWSNRFVYQMVDEAQDNSVIQWELIRLLSGKHKNLFVVGDPDQAIYSFRGAHPEGLVSFSRTFTPCKTIIMDQNYRSTGHILTAANEIIRNNKMRVAKNLFTTKEEGEKIEWMHASNENQEADYVAQKVLALQKDNVPNKDIAILYRSSYQSRFIEQTFVKNQIPYVIWGGTRFFEREEIKNCLAYLHLVDQSDDLAFLRVINYPARKLGRAFVTAVKERAAELNMTYYDTLKTSLSLPAFGKKTAVEFVDLIEKMRKVTAEGSITNLMKYITEAAGIHDSLLKEGETERWENIQELISSIQTYETEHSDNDNLSIESYLQDVSLLTNMDGKDDPKAIKMMTIHQAKGLEFKYIFIIGMSEGNMPHARSLSENRASGLEEERRLAYVAITRAMKKLFISDSDGNNFMTNSQRTPSQFIFEISPVHINALHPEEKVQNIQNDRQTSPLDNLIYPDETARTDFKIGEVVKHPFFGDGTIVEYDWQTEIYSIRFHRSGNILPVSTKFTKLVKAD